MRIREDAPDAQILERFWRTVLLSREKRQRLIVLLLLPLLLLLSLIHTPVYPCNLSASSHLISSASPRTREELTVSSLTAAAACVHACDREISIHIAVLEQESGASVAGMRG